MKRYIFYLLLIFNVVSCYDEDSIHADRGEAKYNLDDDPSDPVQHYIHEFYTDYRVIIIKNPTVYDYKFNFSMKNRIRIVPPRQDKDMLYKGIQYMEKVFFNFYTPEFKRKYFPMSVIMADTIQDAGFGSEALQNSASSTNFVAIANIRDGVETLSDEELKEISGAVNAKFWVDYLDKILGYFKLSPDFYKVSEKHYGEWLAFYDDISLDDIDFYEMGFISDDPEWREIDPNDPPENVIVAPNKDLDLQQWIAFIFETKPAELKEICDKYPKMKTKYELLRQGMTDCGFDFSNLDK